MFFNYARQHEKFAKVQVPLSQTQNCRAQVNIGIISRFSLLTLLVLQIYILLIIRNLRILGQFIHFLKQSSNVTDIVVIGW